MSKLLGKYSKIALLSMGLVLSTASIYAADTVTKDGQHMQNTHHAQNVQASQTDENGVYAGSLGTAEEPIVDMAYGDFKPLPGEDKKVQETVANYKNPFIVNSKNDATNQYTDEEYRLIYAVKNTFMSPLVYRNYKYHTQMTVPYSGENGIKIIDSGSLYGVLFLNKIGIVEGEYKPIPSVFAVIFDDMDGKDQDIYKKMFFKDWKDDIYNNIGKETFLKKYQSELKDFQLIDGDTFFYDHLGGAWTISHNKSIKNLKDFKDPITYDVDFHMNQKPFIVNVRVDGPAKIKDWLISEVTNFVLPTLESFEDNYVTKGNIELGKDFSLVAPKEWKIEYKKDNLVSLRNRDQLWQVAYFQGLPSIYDKLTGKITQVLSLKYLLELGNTSKENTISKSFLLLDGTQFGSVLAGKMYSKELHKVMDTVIYMSYTKNNDWIISRVYYDPQKMSFEEAYLLASSVRGKRLQYNF